MAADDLSTRALTIIGTGLDSRKVWNTLLFHSPETPIHAAFNHNGYGYIKRKDGDPMFHDHITRATSWFRAKIGSDGPRARAMDKERKIREGITTSAQWMVHASLILAHDIPHFGCKEGGAKDFFVASPWQVLNTFTQSEERNPKTRKSIAFQRRIIAPHDPLFKPEWIKHGQPLTNWPHCSIYNSRCDPSLDESKQEYFFTIDGRRHRPRDPKTFETCLKSASLTGFSIGVALFTVDAIHACDAESVKNKDCEADIRLFEQSHADGSAARLCIIGDAVKDAFREIGFETHISWHKSIGWKPSWRGYAVGVIFQNPGCWCAFVSEKVKKESR